jgi:hypothetical protein
MPIMEASQQLLALALISTKGCLGEGINFYRE